MRLEQLRYAEVTFRAGSLRKAAQELGVAQPSLSQQIQRLEEELGVVLLIRRPNGVRPTDAAIAILPHIRTALRAEAHLRQEASAISGLREGRVRLGSIATASRTLLPRVVRRFQQEHPSIHFQVTEGGSVLIRDQVASGDLDVGIVSHLLEDKHGMAGLFVEDIADGRMVVCIPAGHRLWGRTAVTAADLAGEAIIAFHPGYILRTVYDHLATRQEVHAVYYTDSSETARRMVSAGVGIALLSRLGTSDDSAVSAGRIGFLPLQEPWAESRMSVVRRADEQPPPAVRALLRIVRHEARHIQLPNADS